MKSKSTVDEQREAQPDSEMAAEGGPDKAEDIKLPFFPSYMVRLN